MGYSCFSLPVMFFFVAVACLLRESLGSRVIPRYFSDLLQGIDVLEMFIGGSFGDPWLKIMAVVLEGLTCSSQL